MPYKPFKKSKRAYKPKRRYARKATKSTFANKVKKVIHSQLENKVIGTYAANTTINYAGSVTNPTYINLLPQPSQGTTVQQRIGNKIRVMKATINGIVVIKYYSATLNTQASPTMVKMWLCKRKSYNQGIGGLPVAADFAQFFQNGSTTIGFQSNILDMLLKPNTEFWTVLATKSCEVSNNASSTTGTAFSNSLAGSSARFSFSFAKHIGQLMYNDTTAAATNKELYLVFQNVNADGSTSVVAQELSEISYVVEWEYEDA